MQSMEQEANSETKIYEAKHYIHRSNWIRAAVLGANDGIISISSLIIGIISARQDGVSVLLVGVAGLVAGALSMAAGEYVSVSSQTDIEQSDVQREKKELEDMPEVERMRLVEIYKQRGLSEQTAMQVAKELHEKDALGAHIRDELGIHYMNRANPLIAAMASGLSFFAGGVFPLLTALVFPTENLRYIIYGLTMFLLIMLGAISARLGGTNVVKSVVRVTIWGNLTMGLTAAAGYVFGVKI